MLRFFADFDPLQEFTILPAACVMGAMNWAIESQVKEAPKEQEVLQLTDSIWFLNCVEG